MVNIVVHKKSGKVTIDMEGHAGHGKPGEDIVCAGVSAIIQSALLGLEEISKNYPEHVRYIEGGK
ncbi:ribosomal-processing cysteine protease Prp [Romboutsia sp.]|uniref:ribosomal-processing cysteine protease Prp n=1 Tax=Romboutsia sp. TaxID=1965302 RepID=UPI002C0B6DE7|nr:ribosomal-processing cysteine protease Prp [Romboutsia sp.]HSQ90150.1 ribosomal-processing cysteine protease Prp [Romboutsia sp.]